MYFVLASPFISVRTNPFVASKAQLLVLAGVHLQRLPIEWRKGEAAELKSPERLQHELNGLQLDRGHPEVTFGCFRTCRSRYHDANGF